MSARSIGTGTISFGMVSIPIRMYSAGESASAVSFNLLHAKCKSRLKQQYVCPTDNEIVPRDQMVKGYEFSKDQYVSFTDDEIKAMGQEAQKAIEITEFVPVSQVDPIYFDGGYYLGPDKGGEKAYRLLNEAMKQTGRVALAKWAARGKQYLVLIRPVQKGIVMHLSGAAFGFAYYKLNFRLLHLLPDVRAWQRQRGRRHLRVYRETPPSDVLPFEKPQKPHL